MDPETKAREKAFSTYFSGAHAEAAPSAAGGGGCANGAARSSPPRRADAPSAGTTAGGRRRKAWGTPQAPVILAPEAGQASPRVKARVRTRTRKVRRGGGERAGRAGGAAAGLRSQWQRDSLHIAGPGGKAIHVSKAQSARALLQAGPLSTESGSGLGSDSDSGASLGSGDSELEAVSGTSSSSRDIEANVAAKVAALSSSKQRMVVRLLDRLADLDIESETSGDGDVRSSLDLLQRLLASARSPARSPAARSPAARSPAARSPAVQSPAGVAETVDRSPLMLPVRAASTPTRTPLMSPAATVDTPDSLASPTRAASPMALPASRPVARPQFDTLIECTPLRILLSRGDQTTAISLGNVQLFDASGQSVTVLADSQVSLAGVAGPSKLDTSALFDEAAPQWLVPRARDAPAVVVSIAIPSIVPLASVVLTNSNEAASAASWVVVKWDGRQVWSGELALGGSARVNLCGPESAKLSENAAPANRLETDGVAVEASAATEAVPAKVVAAQVLPTEVHSLRLVIRSTHGHRTRVGLTNLSLVDSAGVVIPIDPELDVEVEGLDPSGPAWQAAITPMFNGVTATCSPDDMWLGWLMPGFEPHVEITISYAWTGQARELVLHNYNASLKDSVKCVRGLQVWHDRELVWEGEVSEAKGNAVFPYQHVVELESDVSASYDAPSSLTLSATGGSSPERGGRGTESASPEQASPAPSPPAVWQAPMASTITLNILSTWGDPFYVGMTGLEIIDAETRQPIPLTASALEASPASLNDLDEVSGDPRTVDKLVDGEVATRDDTHMWLIPFTPGADHMLRISLASPRPIAGLRIYNYNKSEEDSFRGVKTFELWLDDAPQVYAGEAYEWVVRKAGATGTEGGHLLELNPQLREAQLATGLGAECESGSGKNEASAWRRREPFVLPTVVGGLVVEIVLLSNWGDLYYMGMDALRGWSLSGEELDLEALCEEVVGTPPDINVLDGVSDDTRGAHNVVVPEEKRRAGMSWLVPWHPAGKAVPRLKLVFPAPVFFSCLELVNYSKTPMRGVRHFQLWVDGLLVYAGTVDAGGRHTIGRRPQAGGSGGPVPSPPSRARRALAEQAVVFTNDRVQVARGGSARSLRHPDAVRWNLKARAASKRPPTSQR